VETLFEADQRSRADDNVQLTAQVVVERGIDRFPDGLTYLVPEELADLEPGERVIVPLGRGNKPAAGYVIEVAGHEGTEARRPAASGRPRNRQSSIVNRQSLKSILRRDEAHHRLPRELVDLADWISGYYVTPLGMVLSSMLPGPVKRDIGRVMRVMVDIAQPGGKDSQSRHSPGGTDSSGGTDFQSVHPASQGLRVRATEPRLTKLQGQVVNHLSALPPGERPVEIHDLAARAGLKTLGPIKALIEKGVLTKSTRTSVEAEWAAQAIDRFIPAKLTDDQARILDEISPELERGFSTHLIFGVTGSGKTEVYIRLIERVIARGKVALMLVPEIALTPQTGGRLIGRFPNHRVAILHSGLTPAQRNQQWMLVAEGKADIILGARSAVFAPVPDERLGLIIVDEEHDSSYKQDQQPRYHGRDVAIRRAQMSDCPIVLASATPSLESWFNAHPEMKAHPVHGVGVKRETSAHPVSYHLHRMPRRIPGTTLPKVTIVDFRAQMRARKDRTRIHLIGPALENEIRRTLDEGHQALLLLNRRGYANFLACPDTVRCNWVMQCEHCDATMVLHRDRTIPTGGFVRCHHCLAEQQVPKQCPQCGKKVINFGLGTQRVEDELSAIFPQLIEGETMMRVDSDTMSSAASFHDVLGRFARNELKLLIGTQMIAKGLDFPNVRLVGVINADTALNLPDFRASERTFQLVNQVAGRCGRGAAAGKVVVQSFQPNALAIQLAARHDYDGFAAMELKTRVESMLPPVSRMARIVIRHEDLPTAVEIATELVNRLRGLIASDSPSLSGRGQGGGSAHRAEDGAPTPQPPPSKGGGEVDHDRADSRIRLRGPAPCPISRIGGRYRQQIELIAPTARDLQTLLAAARSRGWIKSDAMMAIDVDPLALL
jgi:primosomal protein N' (replication factor Y)